MELEIQQLRSNIQVMKHMGAEEDAALKKKINEMDEELKEKIEEMEDLEALNQTLIVKERETNDELQHARKELITVCFLMYLYRLTSIQGNNRDKAIAH